MGEGETKDDEFPASAQLNYFFIYGCFGIPTASPLYLVKLQFAFSVSIILK